MADINKAVQFMVDVANDNTHGYDQTHRNAPDYDCSSLVGTALNYAGFNVSPNSWTGNLRKQLLACGFKEIGVNENRKRGDIFLTENEHVVMCVDGNTIVHASINEKGGIRGGKTGDQTGREICTRSFYTPSYGWDFHLRYIPNTNTRLSVTEIAKEVIAGKWDNGTTRKQKLTQAGYSYTEVQKKVNELLGGNKNTKSVTEVAKEVIAGKWDNGATRKQKLTQAGYNYTEVQKKVNELLK